MSGSGGGAGRRLCCARVCGSSSGPHPSSSLSSSSSSGPSSVYMPSTSSGMSSRTKRCQDFIPPRFVSGEKGLKRVPESLLDICAKVVAFHIPFVRIEDRYERIPEPVQRRIIYWSFPRNEQDICMYSSLSNECSGCGENQKLPYQKGLRLYESNSVENVLQVGFHLSGNVVVRSSSSSSNPVTSSSQSNYVSEPEKSFRVSITFDRCKITSVTCTCDARDIFWCQHVVALALYRMKNPHLVKLRVPISETLLQLDRLQLQKLLQYLIAEHHTEVLPTAQKLADEILQSRSVINTIAGAPDPTSGPVADAPHTWHLDEDQVSEQVRSYLNQGSQGIPNAIKQLNSLFSKVKEMLKAKDSNAARMLRLITEQFLADPRLPVWRAPQNTPMTDKCRVLWDQLAALWVCVVLNPHGTNEDRLEWKALLEKWSVLSICPLEDYEPRSALQAAAASAKRRYSALEDSSDEEEDEENNNNNYKRNRNGSNSHSSPSSGGSSNHGSHSSHHNSHSSRRHRSPPPPVPRSIFHRALEACNLRWDDHHLRYILDHDNHPNYNLPSNASSFLHHNHPSSSCNNNNGSQFTSQGYPLWNENIPTAAARVEALRSHGYRKEGLRLAVAIVRTMKRHQREWQHRWSLEQNRACSSTSTSSYTSHNFLHGTSSSNPLHSNSEGWIGNLLDPISSLFDTLAEASLSDSKTHLDTFYGSLFVEGPSSSTSNPSSSSSTTTTGIYNSPLYDDLFVPVSSSTTSSTSATSPVKDRPRYKHVYVPGSRDRHETFLSLALEAALVGLGQQRLIPGNPYAQEKAWKQEARLIAKLQDIDLDPSLVHVLKKQAEGLLNGGPFSGLGIGIHKESAPMHTFAKYLFKAILPYDEDLAYLIALRAMRLPILEGVDEPDETSMGVHAGAIIGRYPRLQHLTIEHMQRQQCVLAATMLEAAKDDSNRLRDVVTSAKKCIQSSSHLFRLAQNSMKIAVPLADMSIRYEKLMSNALDIGLHVMKITLHTNTYRRDMINWLVDCAMAVGHDALVAIMRNWTTFFTPVEATSQVAHVIMSNTAHTRLSLTYTQSDLLSQHARALAIDCLLKDPPGCALNAFQLCESCPTDFNRAYAIVQAAGANGIMNPAHLFSVAKYMDTRQANGSKRAYRLALLAVKGIHIPYNGDNHPQISEIHWTCQMALNLGKNELAELVPILVHNIQCAPVLTDVLRRCSPFAASTGLPGYHHHSDGKRRSHSSTSSSATTYCHPKTMLVDKAPLRLLLDAAIAAYVNTTHSRLTHISPRHYGDFIEFLSKARETFMLAPDGLMQFANLVENMKMVYKGKKKLMFLVKERFG